jgi:hypothetical protein
VRFGWHCRLRVQPRVPSRLRLHDPVLGWSAVRAGPRGVALPVGGAAHVLDFDLVHDLLRFPVLVSRSVSTSASVEGVTATGPEDLEPDARFLLVHRFRAVAFAALGADVTETELLAALAVAVRADERRRAAEAPPPPRRNHLHVVRGEPLN